MHDTTHTAVTLDHCSHVHGPFYHGTRAALGPGDQLVAGFGSNFAQGRVANHIYFSATLDAAIWGAELAKGEQPGRIYLVEPTGPFEDDPNLTNKRFAGNPTRSYRTRQPLRIVGEVADWQAHPPEAVRSMLAHLAKMAEQGGAVIDD